ncbi:hypothetical protein MSPP1_001476 [Malassezia sp. CBS 17886]|nr:hypothetical protein MSPP1_001476 [Malassezia sp. CBS 17886]
MAAPMHAPLDASPFDDPSVQSAMHGGGRSDLEEDPFDSASLKHGAPSTFSAPVDYDEEAEMYPTSTRGTAPANAMHMDDLRRREQELSARERDLDARTEHMRRFGRNNWPPFYPLVYHDIASEIPPDSQPVMLNLYRLWLLLLVALIVNFVACLVLVISRGFDRLSDLINSIVYLVVIAPASFFLWYRPVYNGLMKEHSIFYYVYFVFCGFHILFSIYAVIGAPGTGCAGVLTSIYAFTQGGHVAAGVLCAITSVLFLIQGLGNAWYYQIIWQHNHEQGHSFAQARAELASHGARAYLMRGSIL